jgi:hypothetical protein
MSDHTASVHRFYDRVAISIPGGPTIYLNKAEARRLGRALRECSMDVSTRTYVNSGFTIWSMPLADPLKEKGVKDTDHAPRQA